MQPQLRKDPVVGRWVIVAPQRGLRPMDVAARDERVGNAAGTCPFCPGNERETTEPTLVLGDDRGWRVRVVPNKYPALVSGPTASPVVLPHSTSPPMEALPGFGVHEVVIDSPRHVRSFSELSDDEACEVFRAYQLRLLAVRSVPGVVHATIFKNAGAAAGASLEHVHSQLIGTPIRPIWIDEEIRGGEEYLREQGRCVFCDVARLELADGQRLVLDREHCVAFCPFASRFGYETWIVPKRHASHFETLADAERDDMARAVREAVQRLEAVLNRAAYNFIIHTAPFDTPPLPHYHWHIEIIPRLTNAAGFEWGTGFFINHFPPEQAATHLRTNA